ncbi:hypothetical protein PFISCL1PPCAC_24283, partial [Pristionchus fissidentatus]
EAEVIIDVLEAKINKYFKAVDHDAIADLYHSDCVIVDRQTKTALFGKEGTSLFPCFIQNRKQISFETWNKKLDLASTHFVYSGDCELIVDAEKKSYKGTFKQILQRFGSDWLLIYELFDL